MRVTFHLWFCLLAAPLAAQTATYAVFNTPTLAVQPIARSSALMAYDELRGRMLLAGGDFTGNPSGTAQDTWEWNGTAWQQIVPATQLNFRKVVRMVWAPQRGQILALVSDEVLNGPPVQLYGWTGTNWVLVNSTGPASFATGYAMAWDAQRGVLVVFAQSNTWEWNGTQWSQRGSGGPMPRTEHRMVYDEARQRVVLYGGTGIQNNTTLTDTWDWNGIYWLEHFGIPAPPVSTRSAIAYDRGRQRVVLHGGTAPGLDSGGVWEFDGTAWTARTTSGAPNSIWNAAMAYQSSAGRMLLFGGTDLQQGINLRTRTLQFVTGYVATSAAHQPGCIGPGGVPTLAAVSGSRPVLGTTYNVRFSSLPNTPAALVFAALGGSDQTWNGTPLPLDLTPIGYTSCMLRIEPATIELLSNNAGIANWGISVPNTPSLDGAVFFMQGLVLTPGFNPGGGVTSSSLRATAGVL